MRSRRVCASSSQRHCASDVSIVLTSDARYRCRYLNSKMINYDTDNGFSVFASQAPSASSSSSSSAVDTSKSNTSAANVSIEEASSESSSSSTTDDNVPSSLIGGTSSSSSKHQRSINHQPQQQQSVSQQQPMSISVLTIRHVNFRHAGNYTCAPSNARSTSIAVHVLKSKRASRLILCYSKLPVHT